MRYKVTAVRSRDDLPPRINKFSEKMMAWYHGLGLHRDKSADDLLRLYPTLALHMEGFTILLEGGGKNHPGIVSVSVFNKDQVIVDERIYGKGLPPKWPHGAIVVDATRVMEYTPLNDKHPKFVPPQ